MCRNLIHRAQLTSVDIPGPALLSSVTQGNSAKGQVPASTPSPAPFSNFSSFTSAPASKSSTPQPAQRSAFSPPAQSSATDPFAALSSLSPTPATSQTPATNDDDEWSFSSALPSETTPQVPREHKALVSNTNLKVDMVANRTVDTDPLLSLLFAFTNNTAQPISELHFQLAVTKVSTPNSLAGIVY